jgi:hypothetical protein
LVANTSTSLQTTLTTEANLTGGQLLVEKQTSEVKKSLIHRTGTRRPTVSKREEFRTKVNVNKEQRVKLIVPHT